MKGLVYFLLICVVLVAAAWGVSVLFYLGYLTS